MWDEWNHGQAWTVGIEEEVMLLEPDGSPAWRSEDVLALLDRYELEDLDGLAVIESSPLQEGRNMSMLLGPGKDALKETAGKPTEAEEKPAEVEEKPAADS